VGQPNDVGEVTWTLGICTKAPITTRRSHEQTDGPLGDEEGARCHFKVEPERRDDDKDWSGRLHADRLSVLDGE
jgi:hypothetical protein